MFNYLNKITNNPLLILGLVIIVIILLVHECMYSNTEGFNPSNPANATALATTIKLAEKFNNAMSIDNDGNVTFNKDVTTNGNVKNKKNVIVDGKVGIGTNNPATKLNVSGGWSDLITLTNPGGKSTKLITGSGAFRIDVNNSSKIGLKILHNNSNVETEGDIISKGELGGKLALNPTISWLICPQGYNRQFYTARARDGQISWFCGKDNHSSVCHAAGRWGWGNPGCDHLRNLSTSVKPKFALW